MTKERLSKPSITRKEVNYHFCCSKLKTHFIFYYKEYCNEEPYSEEIYEDDNGVEFVIYLNILGDNIGEFLNQD